MKPHLENHWRREIATLVPTGARFPTEVSANSRRCQMEPSRKDTKPPKNITLYFAVGLRRFPLLQSDEVTQENVIAAVQHAAQLMQQQEARQ